eukprot:GHVQ01005811.1.p2 GENE.GHVQ01005811.1~~GHVQ01005811.1.p2  ORF type:complete len:115 (+),score=53.35 GHVQ01005811.1:715-1059(+)
MPSPLVSSPQAVTYRSHQPFLPDDQQQQQQQQEQEEEEEEEQEEEEQDEEEEDAEEDEDHETYEVKDDQATNIDNGRSCVDVGGVDGMHGLAHLSPRTPYFVSGGYTNSKLPQM